jgi:adenylate kinase family enzyme
MGESGSGKTTSMRTLDPETTYYIDCDRKGLAWKGWREQYNKEKKNFTSTRDLVKVNNLIINVSDKAPHVKTIVIDTLNTCMVDKEIKEMDNKDGYSKWIDLAQYVWTICETGATLRPDLTVVIVMHSETVRDDFGYTFTRIKTNGRKLEKVVLESLFGTVLLAKCKEDGSYVTVKHGPYAYVRWAVGTSDENLKYVASALYRYGVSAKAYFPQQQ